MSSVIVQPGQDLADLAIQHCGGLDALPEVARLNELNITDLPPAGTTIEVPAIVNKRIARILKDGQVIPASDGDGLVVSIDLPVSLVDISAQYNVEGALVGPGQSLADIAIQFLGSIAAMPDLARLNGINMTDELTVGTLLLLPPVAKPAVVDYMENGNYTPASNVLDELEGIGYWGIEYDFIVS